MTVPVIQANDVQKTYIFSGGNRRIADVFMALMGRKPSSRSVLRDVTFSVDAGEVVGIIGRNGAGKSTLLKLLTGVIRPTTGEIQVNGMVSAILELGMGLSPELNGRQNIRFVASTRGLSAGKIVEKTPAIIEFADIGEYIDYPVRTYSTGMRARLAFAIATSIDPEILIIDEVLAVGDAFFQRKCFKRISELLARNITVLLVTHDLSAVRRICTRGLLIEDGMIKADGDPRDVTRLYESMVNDGQGAPAPDQAETKGSQADTTTTPPAVPAESRCSPGQTSLNVDVALENLAIFEQSCGLTCTRLRHGKSYVLRFDLIAGEADVTGSIGISVKNHRGEAICGEIHPDAGGTVSLARKSTVRCGWEFDAMMLNGVYFVSIDMRADDRQKSLFCVEDVMSFEVEGAPQGRYVGIYNTRSALSLDYS